MIPARLETAQAEARAPRFSPAEMQRRRALTRALMEAHALDAAVVFGTSGVNRHNQANVLWLTNHLDLHHAYLVVPRTEAAEPVLFVGLRNHVPAAADISEVPVAWGGYDPAASVAARLQEIGVVRGRVGLVGVNATFGFGMPYRHYASLRTAMPAVELVDVTAEFAQLRAVKSDEEIAWLRKGAAFSDLAIEVLAHEAREGVPEYALVAIAEGAYRSAGGQPHITFLRSMAMDHPDGCVPAQNPSDRRLRRGDVIITEISASYWGYSGQIQRPVFVGADPTPPWRRLFDAAATAYDRIVDTLRPGTTERDIIRAGSVLGERGYQVYDDLVHGYGVDIHPPIIDRSCCVFWPWQESHPAPVGRRVERGMAIVVQPNPITPDEVMGLQIGALNLITDDRAECLHRVPLEPLISPG